MKLHGNLTFHGVTLFAESLVRGAGRMQLSMGIRATRSREHRRGELLLVRRVRIARAPRTRSGDSTATGAVQEARSLGIHVGVGRGRSHRRRHRTPPWNGQSRESLAQVKDASIVVLLLVNLKVYKMLLSLIKIHS